MGVPRGRAGSWLVARHFLTDGMKAWTQHLGTETPVLACPMLWVPHCLHTPSQTFWAGALQDTGLGCLGLTAAGCSEVSLLAHGVTGNC